MSLVRSLTELWGEGWDEGFKSVVPSISLSHQRQSAQRDHLECTEESNELLLPMIGTPF